MNSITCVIFDLDDTLYNERTYVEQAMQSVAVYLQDMHGISRKDSYDEMIYLLNTEGRGRIFNHVIEKYGISEKVDVLVDIYRETRPHLSLYDDAKECLRKLKQFGIKTAIITDGCSKVQHNKIKGLNLERQIDKIVVTSDYDNAAKPSTVPYRMVRESLCILDASQCVYIGDNPVKDFVGAREDGMRTARIIRPIGDCMNYAAAPGCEADMIIHTLAELSV